MPIYLDHNAGAPLRAEAAAAISRLLQDAGGNPSSVHRAGQRSRRMLEAARAQVATIVGAEPRQIVFTSGGTESNNLAIFGAITAASRRRKIISSEIEHSSILAPLAELERRGFDVVRVAPDSDGRIDPARVLAALDSETALVTLGLANSEVGTIQDLAPLASACSEAGRVVSSRCGAGGRPDSGRCCVARMRSDDAQRSQAWRARGNWRVVRPRLRAHRADRFWRTA